MKVAYLHVSSGLLLKALGLPEDTTIVSAGTNAGDVVLTIEHQALTDQPEGAVGVVCPTFEQAKCGCTSFKDWGQR